MSRTLRSRPPRWRRRLLCTLVAPLLLAAGACTVPNNDEPVELSGSVPFGLLETTTTASTTVPEAVTKAVTVYFLDTTDGGTELTPVPRNVDVAAGIQEVLAHLFTVRPDGGERPAEDGLTSAIPESAVLLSASRVGDTNRLVVDVRGLFGNEGIQGDALRDALAQIVWTATEDPAVGEIVFRNNGQTVQALVDGGEVAEGAVNRNSYDRTG